MNEEKSLEGLRGWLVLVGINVVLGPWVLIFFIATTFLPLFATEGWALITTPGTEHYHPFWKPLVFGEMIINTLLVLMFFFINYLFFLKKRLFPKFYIAILIFMPAFILADALLAKIVMPNDPVFDVNTIKELSRSLFWGVVWVPYMLVSKRAKATFIR